MEKAKKSLLDIELEFKNSLKIPIIKPTKQFFFCPVGLIGSGKSTIAKIISERLNLLRLSTDELRRILKENEYDFELVGETGLRIANEFARLGFSIALDLDCGNPQVKEFVEKIARDLNAKVVWVHINTPEEFIIKGLRKDHHFRAWLADTSEKMIDNYYVQKEKRIRENTSFDFLCTLDNSRSDIDMQIDECEQKINHYINK